jgi:hypothetical protein
MPYFLLQKNHQKRIQLLTQEEANVIPRQEGRSITPIGHCYTAELTGINVYNASSPLPIGIWPTVDALFSKDLIEHIGVVLFHEKSMVIQQNATRIINNATANDRCVDMELPFCKDRSLIVTIISKQVSPSRLQEDMLDYIHKPNLVFELGIPCVPVHQANSTRFYFAYSECLDRFHDSTTLPWLSTREAIYQNLIQPYLHCIKTLHDKHLTHGDLDESNVVLSKRHGRLIFVDFKHVGDVPYVEQLEDDNEKPYYVWQKARLLDLAQMAICVLNLVHEYNPEAAQDNTVIAYLQSVADTLDELLDFHDNCHNDDVEAEKNCIIKHQDWTIDRILQGVCEAHQTPQVAFNFFEPASSPSKRQKTTSSVDNEVISDMNP